MTRTRRIWYYDRNNWHWPERPWVSDKNMFLAFASKNIYVERGANLYVHKIERCAAKDYTINY